MRIRSSHPVWWRRRTLGILKTFFVRIRWVRMSCVQKMAQTMSGPLEIEWELSASGLACDCFFVGFVSFFYESNKLFDVKGFG